MPSKSSAGATKSHAYLGERERSAIENWSQSVTQKPSSGGSSGTQDANVQAYLEAKMNLFRSAGGQQQASR